MIDPVWWQRLAELDPEVVAARAGVQWEPEAHGFRVRLAGTWYRVNPKTQQIQDLDEPERKVGFGEHLVLVVYLATAKQLRPEGRWVHPNTLPGGQFFFRGLHSLPTDKLAEAFGPDPSKLVAAAESLDGQAYKMADAAVVLPALSRVPLLLAVWGADEEFAARASVLLDATATEHLMLDGIWMLANHLAGRLIANTAV